MIASNANSLEEALDHLHTAARTGDLVAFAEAGTTLEAELAVGVAPGNPEQLVRLREKALRNQVILQAVARGIRAAQRRLEDIRNAGKELKTYDERGKPCSVSNVQGQIQRRI